MILKSKRYSFMNSAKKISILDQMRNNVIQFQKLGLKTLRMFMKTLKLRLELLQINGKNILVLSILRKDCILHIQEMTLVWKWAEQLFQIKQKLAMEETNR